MKHVQIGMPCEQKKHVRRTQYCICEYSEYCGHAVMVGRYTAEISSKTRTYVHS